MKKRVGLVGKRLNLVKRMVGLWERIKGIGLVVNRVHVCLVKKKLDLVDSHCKIPTK